MKTKIKIKRKRKENLHPLLSDAPHWKTIGAGQRPVASLPASISLTFFILLLLLLLQC